MIAAVVALALGLTAGLVVVALLAHDAFRRWLTHRAEAARVVAAYEKSYQDLVAEVRALRDNLGGRVTRLENERHALGGSRGRDVIARGEVRP